MQMKLYQQGQLASSLVGTPGVDKSAEMISNAGVSATQHVQNALFGSYSTNYIPSVNAPNHNLAHLAHAAISTVAQGIGDAVYAQKQEAKKQRNIAEAKKANADAQINAYTEAGHVATMQDQFSQAHRQALEPFLLPTADYSESQKEYPKVFTATQNQVINDPTLGFKPNEVEQLKFKNGTLALKEAATKTMYEADRANQNAAMSNVAAQADAKVQKDTAATLGSGDGLMTQLQRIESKDFKLPFALSLNKDQYDKLNAQRPKTLAGVALKSGITQAQNTQFYLKATNGDILEARNGQKGKLLSLLTDLDNHPAYSVLNEEEKGDYRVKLNNAIEASDKDIANAIEHKNSATYTSILKIKSDALTAHQNKDATGAATVASALNPIIDAELAKPEGQRDDSLIKEALSAKSSLVGIGISIDNSNRAAADRNVSIQRQGIQDNRSEESYVHNMSNQKKDEVLKSPAALKSQVGIDKGFAEFAGKINARIVADPENSNANHVEGSGITAKEVNAFGKQLDNAYHSGHIKLEEYRKGIKHLDQIRDAVIPSVLRPGAHPVSNWFDMFHSETQGAPPELHSFMNASTPEQQLVINKAVTSKQAELISKRDPRVLVNGKIDIQNAKLAAAQDFVHNYFTAYGSATPFEPVIKTPEVKPIRSQAEPVIVNDRGKRVAVPPPPNTPSILPTASPEGMMFVPRGTAPPGPGKTKKGTVPPPPPEVR